MNETLARRHWGVREAIGKRLKLGKPDRPQPWLTVAGVVKDVRYREWESVRTDVYIPYMQRAQHRSDFVVKTATSPELLTSAVRAAVASIDKDQSISNVTTMEALVDAALARAWFTMLLLTVFACCALLLASIGIYVLVLYFVAQRRPEIGIRMALGASGAGVVRLIACEGLRLVGAGAALGLAGSLLLTRFLGAVLYGIRADDPGTYAAVMVVLLVCSGAACALPALDAARIDPASALR